jgi:hypothetical protein
VLRALLAQSFLDCRQAPLVHRVLALGLSLEHRGCWEQGADNVCRLLLQLEEQDPPAFLRLLPDLILLAEGERPSWFTWEPEPGLTSYAIAVLFQQDPVLDRLARDGSLVGILQVVLKKMVALLETPLKITEDLLLMLNCLRPLVRGLGWLGQDHGCSKILFSALTHENARVRFLCHQGLNYLLRVNRWVLELLTDKEGRGCLELLVGLFEEYRATEILPFFTLEGRCISEQSLSLGELSVQPLASNCLQLVESI